MEQLTKYNIHINKSCLHSWGLGIDYWREFSFEPVLQPIASVFQISLVFFNITFTKWHELDIFN
jgi:hypothetical protein